MSKKDDFLTFVFIFAVALFTLCMVGWWVSIQLKSAAEREVADAACAPYRARLLDGGVYCLQADGAWAPTEVEETP